MKKWLFLLLFQIVGGFLLYEGYLYLQVRPLLPAGATIAGVEVGGLSLEQAGERVRARYFSPVVLYHNGERVEIDPEEIGFTLDVDGMVQAAQHQWQQQVWWRGYLGFVLGRPLDPVQVPLRAGHNPEILRAALESVAGLLDEPARPPQLVSTTLTYEPGRSGYFTNVEASLPALEAALYQAEDREITLVIEDEAAEEPGIPMLKRNVTGLLQSFSGLGSVFILDLQTGEEIAINADVALSGLSIVKVAILLETYRALDQPPTLDQTKLISETAILSGNYSANLLLDIVAGQNNAYLGVDILTESMHRLGLANTFIATPYEELPRAGRFTYTTPANTRQDVNAEPDPAMQTTAEEIGSLFGMIYDCSKGGGAILALYPDDLTPAECQAILDALTFNVEGNLIRFGVPDGVKVSHKHGWAGGTHGDAGIVFSPGGDYVIVEYLYQEGGWLVADVSFPILREIARAAYNYFNLDAPYAGREADANAATPPAANPDVDLEAIDSFVR